MSTYKIQVSNTTDLFNIIYQEVDGSRFQPYIFISDVEINRPEFPAKIEQQNEDNEPIQVRFKQENLLRLVTIQSYPVVRWLKYLPAWDTVTISNVDTGEQSVVRIVEVEENALSEITYQVTIKFTENIYIKDGCEDNYTITVL